MNKKQMLLNLLTGVIAFLVNLGINISLTPFLVERLGEGAYGYIGLANNFVSYAAIITIALNSMAGRFVSIRIHQNDMTDANRYFSSIFFANVALTLFLGFVFSLVIVFIRRLLNISENLVTDVRITFSVVFFNFMIQVIASIFSVATFAKNKLYLSSIRNLIGHGLRVLITILLFFLFSPKIYYISIGVIVCTMYLSWSNIRFTQQLLPEIKIKPSMFRLKYVIDVTAAGIWVSLNNLSSVLLTGLGLLMANLFISESAMGLLSLSQPIAVAFQTILTTIAGIFAPHFTKLFAKGQIRELTQSAKFSIKVLSLLMTVPFAGFIVFGRDFYALWLPTKSAQEIMTIQILSVFTLLPLLVSGYFYSLYAINTTTNHIKIPALVNLLSGVVSFSIVYVLLRTTSLGIYAIAGTSGVLLLLRVLFFFPMYTAHTLQQPISVFYPHVFRSIFIFVIIAGVFFAVGYFITIDRWIKLFEVSCVCGLIGYAINYYVLLSKQDRHRIREIIRSKILAKG